MSSALQNDPSSLATIKGIWEFENQISTLQISKIKGEGSQGVRITIVNFVCEGIRKGLRKAECQKREQRSGLEHIYMELVR